MLQDGSRMPQDGLKDHPGDFSWIGASELQDARGWLEDAPGWS